MKLKSDFQLRKEKENRDKQKYIDWEKIARNDAIHFEQPVYTWQVYLFGLERNYIVSVVKPPCWFWRTTQYLVFGNKWEKIIK